MLAFKKNIYSSQTTGSLDTLDALGAPAIDPVELLQIALKDERETIDFLERQPRDYWHEDGKKFYPHLYRVGGPEIMRTLLENLLEGLESKSCWHHMNTYHYCFLYNVLIRFSFNYNHDNREERKAVLPQLKGGPLNIKTFIKQYFKDTVFLLTPDQYNAMSGEEKLKKGFDCPHQFGVINGLMPTREEMQLRQSNDYPYSIYV
ncbi:MAG: hypothetical protein G3M78_09810 [Candidatus Nitrohelix vancouverensis]|uniref:Uncharacterized protein n=1 Tax=Candidatus Nitrohelix vancouverensis TaxID=2705534 RepID=A0A7T0G3V7_9BACT|nr:MAG: hypothetical protein G3M78_09810 [Candidatus Nitrohelix vancouverensis]